jgi:hypothetical protein
MQFSTAEEKLSQDRYSHCPSFTTAVLTPPA